MAYGGVTYDLGVLYTTTNPKESVTAYLNGIAATATSLSVNFGFAPVHAIAPVDGTNGVSTTTPFSWSSAPFEVLVACGTKYHLSMHTTNTSITLPDETALGVTFPTGASWHWGVRSFPTLTINDFVGDPTQRAKYRHSSNSSVNGVTFTSQ